MQPNVDLLQLKNDLARIASEMYYVTGRTFMSDKEYDDLTNQIEQLEYTLGQKALHSITQNVGTDIGGFSEFTMIKNNIVDLATKLQLQIPYDLDAIALQYQEYINKNIVKALKNVRHEEKALSLDKTKDRVELASWLGNHSGVLSWKLDGLTGVATYDNGSLVSLVTRGNGEIGEDVTHNAKYVKGLPQTIPYTGHLVVRGECLMTFTDFDKVNSLLPNEEKFKNPRNLASGTIRALNPMIVKSRGITFICFESVTNFNDTFEADLENLKKLGFNVVPYTLCKSNNLVETIDSWEKNVKTLAYPTDGLVLQMNDIESHKLGTTGKYPRWAKAFKWKDELAQTIIKQIVWQPSRTGLINPVAIFNPVELEGTTVSRATCNNISFMQRHNLTVGSQIEVYKANMIIPTIYRNINPTFGDYRTTIPRVCPCCGASTQLMQTKEAVVLICPNSQCSAKNIKSISHYVTRDAMNIVGIAESTIDLLNQNGYLNNPIDFYTLDQHPEIANLDGLGTGSYNNMIESIEKSKKTTLNRYIYAWGIDQIGKRASKDLSDKCKGSVDIFVQAMDAEHNWTDIDGFGEVMNTNLYKWWKNPTNRANFIKGLSYIKIDPIIFAPSNTTNNSNNPISGKTFCVTGSVSIFKNRAAVGEYIEARGGKLASSVTSKTDYLMTNDTTSGSSKNKKAKELGKEIITEEQLIQMGGPI